MDPVSWMGYLIIDSVILDLIKVKSAGPKIFFYWFTRIKHDVNTRLRLRSNFYFESTQV